MAIERAYLVQVDIGPRVEMLGHVHRFRRQRGLCKCLQLVGESQANCVSENSGTELKVDEAIFLYFSRAVPVGARGRGAVVRVVTLIRVDDCWEGSPCLVQHPAVNSATAVPGKSA